MFLEVGHGFLIRYVMLKLCVFDLDFSTWVLFIEMHKSMSKHFSPPNGYFAITQRSSLVDLAILDIM